MHSEISSSCSPLTADHRCVKAEDVRDCYCLRNYTAEGSRVASQESCVACLATASYAAVDSHHLDGDDQSQKRRRGVKTASGGRTYWVAAGPVDWHQAGYLNGTVIHASLGFVHQEGIALGLELDVGEGVWQRQGPGMRCRSVPLAAWPQV